MAHRNVAAHRAKELRARLGYLISPEQERALNDLEAALSAQLGELATLHTILRGAYEAARSQQGSEAAVLAALIPEVQS